MLIRYDFSRIFIKKGIDSMTLEEFILKTAPQDKDIKNIHDIKKNTRGYITFECVFNVKGFKCVDYRVIVKRDLSLQIVQTKVTSPKYYAWKIHKVKDYLEEIYQDWIDDNCFELLEYMKKRQYGKKTIA
jgi:hypothetical protein